VRLTAWNVASSFLIVFSVTGALYWALARHLDREDDEFLTDKARLLRVLLAEGPGDSAALQQAVRGDRTHRPFGHINVRVLDDRGQALLETPGFAAVLAAEEFPDPVALDDAPLRGTEVERPAGKTYRIVAVRTTIGAQDRTLQLAFDRTAETALLRRYRRNLWIALGAALLVCGVVAHQVARRGLRPLADITAAARRVQATTLHARLPVRRQPAEVAALAETFNAMLDRLEESFRRLDRFAADIAHELRTPVNNLRGEAEVALGQPRSPEAYREVLGSCLEECGRLTRLIDSLLFLARAQGAKVPLTTERVRVARELEAVCAFYEAAAAEAGVVLAVRADDVVADLDRTLFQRAVANLVANALAHTPAAGTVTLSAEGSGACLRVGVEDTGSGIAPEHLPYLFDRFYRADPARTTASGRVGLGLAIVKSIAELHGGTATVASTVGRGTRVTLTIPFSGKGAEPRQTR
jgi:two-component system heavy metal sensor histidine kinase CusS